MARRPLKGSAGEFTGLYEEEPGFPGPGGLIKPKKRPAALDLDKNLVAQNLRNIRAAQKEKHHQNLRQKGGYRDVGPVSDTEAMYLDDNEIPLTQANLKPDRWERGPHEGQIREGEPGDFSRFAADRRGVPVHPDSTTSFAGRFTGDEMHATDDIDNFMRAINMSPDSYEHRLLRSKHPLLTEGDWRVLREGGSSYDFDHRRGSDPAYRQTSSNLYGQLKAMEDKRQRGEGSLYDSDSDDEINPFGLK